MDFVVQPDDLGKVARAAQAIDGNPLRIVGRMAGLGADELDAGVPTWAWVAIAFGAGAAAAVVWGPTIRQKFRF